MADSPKYSSQKPASKPKKKAAKTKSTQENKAKSASKDATPAIKNFLIGLAVCCFTIVAVVVLVINFKSVKNMFVSASQSVSNAVPRVENKPGEIIQVDRPPPADVEAPGEAPQGSTEEAAPAQDENLKPRRKTRTRIESY